MMSGVRPSDAAADQVEGRTVGRQVVLDTNIVLDALVFSDPAAVPLRAGLDDGSLRWIATPPTCASSWPVCWPIRRSCPDWPSMACRQTRCSRRSTGMPSGSMPRPRRPVTCADPDDQIFIDLAVRHRCALLSKDRAVLRMRKRLAALGVHAGIALAHQPA
jgi:hypothetical protein